MHSKEQTITISSLDPESVISSFQELKQEISVLKTFIENNLVNSKSEEVELWTREQTAKFFKVNISTIRNWSIKGDLQPYYIGDRVYFKSDEVKDALIRSNISINKK